MTDNPASDALKQWYQNFIQTFREEYSKLSDVEKQFLHRDDNYLTKCQIEVFWLKRPSWQVMVRTHFQDRPDGEIIINGPYDSTVFVDEVKKVISDQRWNRLLHSDGNYPSQTIRFTLYNEIVADELWRFIEIAKNALFDKFENYGIIATSYTHSTGTKIERCLGNKADTDHREEVRKIIQDIKRRATYNTITQVQNVESTSLQPEAFKGFGAYFFPPIVIGKIQKPTAVDILEGHRYIGFYTFDKKSFDVKFMQTLVIITKDGYVGVCDKSKENSLKILNTIMAVSTLEGLDAYAVREHELSQIDYDLQTLNITGYNYDLATVRNQLFREDHGEKILEHQIKEVQEDKIKNVLQKASEIFKNEQVSGELRIFLEALTHLKDSEFSQAFFMGWLMIELYISYLYRDKQRKLVDSSEKYSEYMAVDYMLKKLRAESIISQQEFDSYFELKEKRNEFVHSGKSITKEEVEKCVSIAKEIVMKKLNVQ